MHSARYAFAAGVECSKGTLVMMSSRTFFMTWMSSGSNWGMTVAPDMTVNRCFAILNMGTNYFFTVGGSGRVNNQRDVGDRAARTARPKGATSDLRKNFLRCSNVTAFGERHLSVAAS